MRVVWTAPALRELEAAVATAAFVFQSERRQITTTFVPTRTRL